MKLSNVSCVNTVIEIATAAQLRKLIAHQRYTTLVDLPIPKEKSVTSFPLAIQYI